MLETTQIKQRLPFIDLIRGITIIEMISYHFLWDLVYLYNADIPWYKSHGAYIWQQSICWTFILLAGFSWHLGKKHMKRGLWAFGGGVVVWLCSEFSVNAYPHGKTVHILRSSEPEAEAEPPPMAARSVLDRLA